MHPRERVLGLAALLRQQNKPYPTRLILEAKKLGVPLPEPKPTKTKEIQDGPSQSN